MAPSFTSASTHVDSAPVPDQAPQESAATPAPRKKTSPRSTPLADAKKILRAAKAVTSKSLAVPSARRSPGGGGPQFIHHPPDLARHRRKCAICHHPEREAIEDLFIHWHSPSSIASYYDDGDEESNEKAITWVSIYRHAYAFGLDEIRRRNLRFAFELLLEQADQITPTSATLIAAARALGSCVNENGAWNEPPKRVLVTNIIRNEPPQTALASTPASSAEIEPEQFSCRASFPPCPEGIGEGRDVFTPAGEADVTSSAPRAFVGADRSHRPAPSETNDNPSSDAETNDELSSFRACPDSPVAAPHPPCPERICKRGDVVDPVPASLPPGFSACVSSTEIRNSPNSFKSKEPPISNR